MASVEHNLPAEILAEDKSSQGLYRPGLSMTPSEEGYSLTRVWSDMNLRSYELSPIMLDANDDGLRNMKHFLKQTTLGTSPFWLKEQVTGQHFGVPCGGLGDASADCFPIPFYGSITDPVILIDEVPQLSGVTIHSAANMLPDATAIPTTTTSFILNGAEANQANFGLVAPYCTKITPDTVSTCRWYVPSADSNGAAVTVGNDYTVIVAIHETKASARNFRVGLRWYDATPAYLSTSRHAGEAATYGAWKVFSYTATAPASTAWVVPEIQEPGADADPWFVGAAAICPASYDRWHLPSFAPNIAEFSSAPATGERITASGEGTALARCVLGRSVSEWSMISPGHATIRRIIANEEVEV
jgi:hypothetical protein